MEVRQRSLNFLQLHFRIPFKVILKNAWSCNILSYAGSVCMIWIADYDSLYLPRSGYIYIQYSLLWDELSVVCQMEIVTETYIHVVIVFVWCMCFRIIYIYCLLVCLLWSFVSVPSPTIASFPLLQRLLPLPSPPTSSSSFLSSVFFLFPLLQCLLPLPSNLPLL